MINEGTQLPADADVHSDFFANVDDRAFANIRRACGKAPTKASYKEYSDARAYHAAFLFYRGHSIEQISARLGYLSYAQVRTLLRKSCIGMSYDFAADRARARYEHVFNLRYVDNLTWREIGSRLGVTDTRANQMYGTYCRLLKYACRKTRIYIIPAPSTSSQAEPET